MIGFDAADFADALDPLAKPCKSGIGRNPRPQRVHTALAFEHAGTLDRQRKPFTLRGA